MLITRSLKSTIYRVFYLDSSGTVQDIISTNTNDSRSPGNIGSYNIKAPLAQGIGLNVQARDNYGVNQTGWGIRLFVANPQGLIQEYEYDTKTDSWTGGFVFPESNGYGGLAGTWLVSNLTELFLFNKHSKLEYWWRDWGQDSTFPLGLCTKGNFKLFFSSSRSFFVFFYFFKWALGMAADMCGVLTKTTCSIFLHFLGAETLITLPPNSSIVVDWRFYKIYYQDNDFAINGISYFGSANTFRWDFPNNFVTQQATRGTKISWATCPPDLGNGDPPLARLYFRTNGSNIVEYGNFDSGWNKLGDIDLG